MKLCSHIRSSVVEKFMLVNHKPWFIINDTSGDDSI